jgi:(4-(4-[2-(gamma-L-glutamylamino)ethyl]phenoxymethyl)furan-2-yl)methanamine synthase
MERDMGTVIGWDVGGVHLKAARAENGRIVDAVQIASPLRAGLDPLDKAFAEAKARMGLTQRHVVTMTGELADTFSSHSEGVERLTMLVARELVDAPVSLYAGPAGFVSPNNVRDHIGQIASANWHASASLVGRSQDAALFVDMGSTTTDLVPVIGGSVAARGYTDGQRLAVGELVYTGLLRSLLIAVADRAPFGGHWTPLINENFANMADVHRIFGTLAEGIDLLVTADGRDKTADSSRVRLARIVGRDASDADDATWTALARWFAEAQIRSIADAAMLVLSRDSFPADAPVVGAGIGNSVLREVARRLERNYIDFDTMLDVAPVARVAASHCAPAAALAILGSTR